LLRASGECHRFQAVGHRIRKTPRPAQLASRRQLRCMTSCRGSADDIQLSSKPTREIRHPGIWFPEHKGRPVCVYPATQVVCPALCESNSRCRWPISLCFDAELSFRVTESLFGRQCLNMAGNIAENKNLPIRLKNKKP